MNLKQVITLVVCFLLLIAAIICKFPIHSESASQQNPFQQIDELRQELNNVKQELATIRSLNVNFSTNNLHVYWLDLVINDYPIVIYDDSKKSIKWGFREDGAIIWKAP